MYYLIGVIAIILGVALDQYTKYLAVTKLQGNPITIIEGVFQLQYLENRGAAFGMLQNQQLFFIIATSLTIVIFAFLFVRLPKTKHFLPLHLCLGSMIIGAIGNMIDRIRLQYVIDFLYFELIDFPIFNVADIFASVAAFALIILFLFYYKDNDFDFIFALFKKKQENK
jgi:signal peptidase II